MSEAATLPILYALMTAVLFGGQAVLTMRSLAHVDPQTSSMIATGTCVLIFWLLAPFLLRGEYWLNPGMWVFLANGLVHPLISMYLSFEAIKRMGATVSSTVSAITPLFATAGAVLILGEYLTQSIVLGTMGTVLGVMVLSWKGKGSTTWALSALIFPIGAAFIRGASSILGKFGLEMLPSPYSASLVSFTVSFIGTLLIYRYRLGRFPGRLPGQGLKWAGLSGVTIAMGVLCMYSALNSGLVVVVAPIISTYPLFTLLISLFFRQEALGARLFIGVILVVSGITWIGLQ